MVCLVTWHENLSRTSKAFIGSQAVLKNGKEWFLSVWWPTVVQNCWQLLKNDGTGLFVLNMHEPLMESMHERVLNHGGFTLLKKEGIKLARSHMNKATNPAIKEKLEPVWFYSKQRNAEPTS